jgi:hypothetical protein
MRGRDAGTAARGEKRIAYLDAAGAADLPAALLLLLEVVGVVEALQQRRNQERDALPNQLRIRVAEERQNEVVVRLLDLAARIDGEDDLHLAIP